MRQKLHIRPALPRHSFFPQRCDFGFDVVASGNDRFDQRFVFVQFHSFQNRKAAFHLHHFLFHQIIELGRIALGHDFSVGSNQNGRRQSARAGSLRNAQTLMERMVKNAALSIKEEAEFSTGISEGFNGPHAPGMGGWPGHSLPWEDLAVFSLRERRFRLYPVP